MFDEDFDDDDYEQEQFTIDGFPVQHDRRMFAPLPDEGIVQMIQHAFTELALRRETGVYTSVGSCFTGAAKMAQLPPEYRRADEEEMTAQATLYALITQKIREYLPIEAGMLLIPGQRRLVDEDGEPSDEYQLDFVVTVALGNQDSTVLWRHARAAQEEMDFRDPAGNKMGSEESDPVWDELDQACGFYGFSLDGVPTTEERD